MSEFVVEFLKRSNCPLCDAAKPQVKAAVTASGGSFMEVDIDDSADLTRKFGSRIPVVRSGEQVLAEGIIDARELKRRLRKLGKQNGPPA